MKKTINKCIAVCLTAIFIILVILCIRISKQNLLGEYLYKAFNFKMIKISIAVIVLVSRYYSGVICKKIT